MVKKDNPNVSVSVLGIVNRQNVVQQCWNVQPEFNLKSIWKKGTLTDENKNMGMSVSKRTYCQRLDFRNLEFQNEMTHRRIMRL